MKRDKHDALPAVLITGASTGIGATCARELARRGYRVFAGVRREEDGLALASQAPENLTWVQLDITDSASLERAVRAVAAAVGEAGLAGLVNNAGISSIGPLEFLPLADLCRLLEVNVVGQLATIQTFLPLLRRAGGRIINIGSISGQLVLPFGGGYSASKFALEALTEELRIELAPWKIRVSIIEPGGIATPLWEKSQATLEQTLERFPAQASTYYAPIFPLLRSQAAHWHKHGTAPGQVTKTILHALSAPRPRRRYFVGRRAGLLPRLLIHLPGSLRDRLIATQLPRYPSPANAVAGGESEARPLSPAAVTRAGDLSSLSPDQAKN